MTKYAADLPFAANDGHNFVHLLAPNPDIPSHFISRTGRYFPNFEGHVYVPEELVDEMIQDGCTVDDSAEYGKPQVEIAKPPVPAYTPMGQAPAGDAPSPTTTFRAPVKNTTDATPKDIDPESKPAE